MNAMVSGNSVFISRSREVDRMYGIIASPPNPTTNPIVPNTTPVTTRISGDRTMSSNVEMVSGRGIPIIGPLPNSCETSRPTNVPMSHSANPVSAPTPMARERYISTLLDIRAWLSFFSMSATKSLSSSNIRW